jgi:hypothetical protein
MHARIEPAMASLQASLARMLAVIEDQSWGARNEFEGTGLFRCGRRLNCLWPAASEGRNDGPAEGASDACRDPGLSKRVTREDGFVSAT